MKTQMHTTHHRLMALAMAIAMALTLSVSALASDSRPWNADNTRIVFSISQVDKVYSATVKGPAKANKTELSMVLYEKGALGYKKVDSASASASKNTCTKTVSCAFKSGKTYKLEVTGKAYVSGAWDTVSDSVVKTICPPGRAAKRVRPMKK